MCIIGSKAFIANEVIENEPRGAVGEWMAGVFTPYGNGSSTACLIFDLKVEEFAKRINVEIIYQDVNNTIQKASLFDYDIGTKDNFARERFGTFELHLNNVLKYQVCTSCFIIYSLYLIVFYSYYLLLLGLLLLLLMKIQYLSDTIARTLQGTCTWSIECALMHNELKYCNLSGKGIVFIIVEVDQAYKYKNKIK